MLLYTVGHSTRPLDEFIATLQSHAVELLIDVRTVPRSRHNPQFNSDALSKDLAARDIAYRHMKELGGLRKASKDSINAGWRNASFRGYADYMQTADFEAAVNDLLLACKQQVTALMCAEAVPWRCHRSLIADALTVRGVEVRHIMSRDKWQPHKLTAFAQVEGTRITYPFALEG